MFSTPRPPDSFSRRARPARITLPHLAPTHVSLTTYDTAVGARSATWQVVARPTRPPPATLLHGLDSPRSPLLPPPLFIMVKTTLVVRASDALPLAASVDDEQVGAFPVLCVMAC